MKLIQKFNDMIKEDAAGGAMGAGGSFGGMAMPLFSKIIKRAKAKPTNDEFVGSTDTPDPKPKKSKLREAYDALSEDIDDASTKQINPGAVDLTGIMSKLKGLENRESADHRHTVTFGLKDEDDQIVRVVVKHEQAADFEKALEAYMAEADMDEEQLEIAEILFKLKDRFDIIDVQWPDVQEDEEQEMDLEGGDVQDGEMDDVGDDAEPVDLGAAGGDTGQVETLLTQVIDMMKADAEARTADARAREAEAKVKEADAIARQAMTKVKQEEQFLDMDMYNKAKKEEEREAKRLAQLSRWKHDVSNGEGDDDEFESPPVRSISAPEDEEKTMMRPPALKPQRAKPSPLRGKIHPHDVASIILNRVK